MEELSKFTGSGSVLRALGVADLVEIAAIVAIAVAAVLVVERGVPPIATRLGARARALILPWIPVFRLVVLGVTLMILIQIVIKPGTEGLLGLVGAGAFAIGFAFKDYLTSILAGIVVLFERPYRLGDWVRVGDVYGEVCEMGMRAARVRTPDDDMVAVPHGQIWTSMIRNANDGAATLQCTAEFFVHPDHDAQRLHRALADAALASPWIDVSKEVIVLVRERPWGTQYRVKAYPVAAKDQFCFVSDVTVRGKGLLAELGARSVTVPTAELAEAG